MVATTLWGWMSSSIQLEGWTWYLIQLDGHSVSRYLIEWYHLYYCELCLAIQVLSSSVALIRLWFHYDSNQVFLVSVGNLNVWLYWVCYNSGLRWWEIDWRGSVLENWGCSCWYWGTWLLLWLLGLDLTESHWRDCHLVHRNWIWRDRIWNNWSIGVSMMVYLNDRDRWTSNRSWGIHLESTYENDTEIFKLVVIDIFTEGIIDVVDFFSIRVDILGRYEFIFFVL